MQSKTKLKSDFVTVTDILLIVEKGIKREICHSVYQYAKEYNKYMKDYGNSICFGSKILLNLMNIS